MPTLLLFTLQHRSIDATTWRHKTRWAVAAPLLGQEQAEAAPRLYIECEQISLYKRVGMSLSQDLEFPPGPGSGMVRSRRNLPTHLKQRGGGVQGIVTACQATGCSLSQ